ncbi:MAG TPA: serine hydrolase domain-containing protein [Candidatus Obscuribacterales bacterium]
MAFSSVALLSGCAAKFPPAVANRQLSQRQQVPDRPVVIDTESIPNVEPLYKNAVGSPRLLPPDKMPITGVAPNQLKSLDDKICKLLEQYDMPGCSVAIAKNGHLVAARGYGWSDIQHRQSVQPDSLFRLASVSKILTSVAALKLVQDGKLSLDTKVFPLLNYAPFPVGRRIIEPRLNQITVVQLLQSTAGFNRERSGDPVFAPYVQEAAAELSPTLRADPEIVIRYWTNTHQLDFEPGTRHVYSNLEYAILGRVISAASSESYAEYVRKALLEPMGVHHMRLGKTVVAAPGEVIYYPFAGQEMNRSVLPNYNGPVPLPYGGDFSMEAMEADTGWIASAPALAKYACTVLGDRKTPSPLSDKIRTFMTERPPLPQWDGAAEYFACGWEVNAEQNPMHCLVMKQGSLAGCMAFVGRRSDGVTVAWLVNSRPAQPEVFHKAMTLLILDSIDNQLQSDGTDLFDQFN